MTQSPYPFNLGRFKYIAIQDGGLVGSADIPFTNAEEQEFADIEILPGFRTIASFGHTPDNLGLEMQSQGELLLLLTDSALHPLHLEHPGWVAKMDMDPNRRVATQMRLFDRGAAGKVRVQFFHFDFPGIGYVERYGDTWRWRPDLTA